VSAESEPELEADSHASIVIGNEFSEVRIRLVQGHNGDRVVIESLRSDHSISLCPLELEALTWQDTATFTAMIAHPLKPMFEEDD
jgi:hypothetical protein